MWWLTLLSRWARLTCNRLTVRLQRKAEGKDGPILSLAVGYSTVRIRLTVWIPVSSLLNERIISPLALGTDILIPGYWNFILPPLIHASESHGRKQSSGKHIRRFDHEMLTVIYKPSKLWCHSPARHLHWLKSQPHFSMGCVINMSSCVHKQ